MKYDVIIIGAGPGGIFAAYELSQKKPELKAPVLFPRKDGDMAAIRMPATPEVFSFGVQASFVAGEFIVGVGLSVAFFFPKGINLCNNGSCYIMPNTENSSWNRSHLQCRKMLRSQRTCQARILHSNFYR